MLHNLPAKTADESGDLDEATDLVRSAAVGTRHVNRWNLSALQTLQKYREPDSSITSLMHRNQDRTVRAE
jgi:hypothetical protein